MTRRSASALTYRSAGVDIDAGDRLVERILPLARGTRRPEVLTSIGGFAAAFRAPRGMRSPVFVTSTDGVGTKLRIAILLDRHDTVGIDLVAMNVNDVLALGAEPLVFLDYFATGQLDVRRRDASRSRESPPVAGRRAARSSAAKPRRCPRSTRRESTIWPASWSVPSSADG